MTNVRDRQRFSSISLPSSVQQPEELSSLLSRSRQIPAATPHFQANAPIELLQMILLRIVNSEPAAAEFTRLLNSGKPPWPAANACPEKRRIPLKWLRQSTAIAYRSAWPQVLAAGDGDRQSTIAEGLQAAISTLQTQLDDGGPSPLSLPTAIREITVTRTIQFDLEFKLQDGAIAYWLNRWLHPDFTMPAIGMPDLPDIAGRTFKLQHAHARSYRLGQQALTDDALSPSQQKVGTDCFGPDSLLPWHWSAVQLVGLSPAHWQLIPQLIQVLDWTVDPAQHSAKRLFLLTESVAQGFTALHQACQLWHPDFQQSRDRRQTYGQLLITTQRVLQRCLHSLGAIAPFTL